MIALARKYRPRNFATVAVQSHVSNTMKGAIARGRVAHGYLLCGPRGVGKTTLARVLAMALNCDVRIAAAERLKQAEENAARAARAAGASAEGVSASNKTLPREAGDVVAGDAGEPCGVCASCTRIWSGGTSLDVVEIDAASNRGVDDARELRERAMYAPSGDHRYKVYIVDEAHMLTREAWNALLKILEEPPPRVVFVFATTEPHKIAQAAAPVLSRLQRFDFKRIGPTDIRERLTAVLKEENVAFEPDALGMISRAADGSMRDALSLTDQVLALGDGEVTVDRVREALGLVAEDEYLAVLDLVADRRASDVFPTIARLVEQGVDLGQFVVGFGDMLRAQLAIVLGATQVEASDRAHEALRSRKNRFSAGDLIRMLSALLELEPKFRRSGQQQLLLETLLIRFALLDRTIEIESVLRELGGATGGGGGTAAGAARSTASSRPAPTLSSLPPEKRRSGAPEKRETPAVTARVQGTDAPRVSSANSPRPEGADSPRNPSGDPTSRLSDESPRGQGSDAGRDTIGDSPRAPQASAETGAEAAHAPNVANTVAIAERPAPRQAGARPAPKLDIDSLVGFWDDIVATLRADRPIVGALLEKAIPTAVSASGVVTLQVDDPGHFEGLSARSKELTSALAIHIGGLVRVQLLPPEASTSAGPTRMTAESFKSESLSALRKRDPVLGAAIDELDLDLFD